MKIKTKVKIILRKKMAVLVEYSDKNALRRVSIPFSSLIEDKSGDTYVYEDMLDQGLPYGVPWSDKLVINAVKPEDVENSLHEFGIWTGEDALKNPQAVQLAVMSSMGIAVRDILSIAKDHMKKE